MGTKYAPNYTNTFMGMFEEWHKYTIIETMLPAIHGWHFLIWAGTNDQLMKFEQTNE